MAPRPPRPDFGPYAGTTYHGRPALKPSPFDWKVSAYVFIGGLAGSAQILAALADLGLGRRGAGMVRTGRYLGVAGSALGALFLVMDLKTPQRWYNMLRILRTTSPMSFGSYLLTAFGGFSGLAALAQFLADTGLAKRKAALRFARLAGAPAALTGAGMSVYTAALLSATSTPLWSAAPRLLAVRFGSSAMAAAASALSLAERAAGRRDVAARLDRVALAAGALEAWAVWACDRAFEERGVHGVLGEGPWRQMRRSSELAVRLSTLTHALNVFGGRDLPSVIASLGLLLGSALDRHLIMDAGNHSAGRPEDYFLLAQPPRDGAREMRPLPSGGERPIREAAVSAARRKEDTIAIGPE